MTTGRNVANGVPTLFGLVLALWALGYGLALRGAEPFPALLQPTFGYVLDQGDRVQWVDFRYSATFDDGRTEPVDYHRLFPDSGARADTMAYRLFTPASIDDPRTATWVRDRLAVLGYHGEPVRLTVTATEHHVDTSTGAEGDGLSKTLVVLDLGR